MKNSSILIAFLIIVCILYFRYLSFIRNPLDISPPYKNITIIALISIMIISAFLLIFSYHGTKMNNLGSKPIVIFMSSLIIKPFQNLHIFLAENLSIYGEFCNYTVWLLMKYNLLKYCFLLIFIFIVVPFCIVTSVIIIESVYLGKLHFTFKILPLLLIPLLFKIILVIVLDFVDYNINRISTSLHLVKLKPSANRLEIFDQQYLDYLSENSQVISQLQKRDEPLEFYNLSTRELYFYLLTLTRYKNQIECINSISSFYSRFFSNLRYIVFILIIINLLMNFLLLQ